MRLPWEEAKSMFNHINSWKGWLLGENQYFRWACVSILGIFGPVNVVEEIQTSEVGRHCFLGHNYFSSHHQQFYAIFTINRLISINSSRLKSAEKDICLGWLDEHSLPFSSQKKQIPLLRCGEDQKVELLWLTSTSEGYAQTFELLKQEVSHI